MSIEWKPIARAEKDSGIKLSMWRDSPVFIAWFPPSPDRVTKRRKWIAPFLSREFEETKPGEPGGWYVLSWSPRLGWGVNGNCAPFEPEWFAEIDWPPGMEGETP